MEFRSATTAGAAAFTVDALGRYQYTVRGWVDPFVSWRHDLVKRARRRRHRIAARSASLIGASAARASADDLRALEHGQIAADERYRALRRWRSTKRSRARARYPDRRVDVRAGARGRSSIRRARALQHLVRALPALGCAERRRHGTLQRRDRARCPYVAGDGLRRAVPAADPPDRPHAAQGPEQRARGAAGRRRQPVGDRRGAKAATRRSIRELGTLDDFRRLVDAGARRAASRSRSTSPSSARPTIRTSSEHPRVVPRAARRHHPVRREPAEEVPGHLPVRLRDRRRGSALWEELKSVFEFWIGAGRARSSASTTRTPSRSPFWEWVIARGEARASRTSIFLAEAFTRPKVMHRLAKLGFTQSYTYFTWRNTKQELIEYFTELTQQPVARVLPAERLAEHARHPARDAAARRPRRRSSRASCSPRRWRRTTASTARRSSCSSTSRASRAARNTSTRRSTSSGTGTSSAPDSLRELIARVNRIRRENPALQRDWSLRFHPIDNDQLIAYAQDDDGANVILTAVNLDPQHPQSGWVELDLARARHRPARDLPGARPAHRRALHLERRAQLRRARSARSLPAHVFQVRRDAMTSQSAGGAFSARRRSRGPLWYKDAVIYQLHVKAFFDSQRRRHRRLPRPDREARLHPGPRRQRDLAAAVLSVAAARTTATTSPTTTTCIRSTARVADFRQFVREAHRRGLQGDHRAGDQPHLGPASVVPGRAPRARRARRSATTTSGATPTRSTRARASSSPTPRPRTGPGTRSPSSTTGTASSATSRTSTSTTRTC